MLNQARVYFKLNRCNIHTIIVSERGTDETGRGEREGDHQGDHAQQFPRAFAHSGD